MRRTSKISKNVFFHYRNGFMRMSLRLLIDYVARASVTYSKDRLFRFRTNLINKSINSDHPLSTINKPFRCPSTIFTFQRTRIRKNDLFLRFPNGTRKLSQLSARCFIRTIMSSLIFTFLRQLVFRLFSVHRSENLARLNNDVYLIYGRRITSSA